MNLDELKEHLLYEECHDVKDGVEFLFGDQWLGIYEFTTGEPQVGIHLSNPTINELLNAVDKALNVGYDSIFIRDFDA